jgi:hypothetical protein
MSHNVTLIGSIWLLAIIITWLVCRWRGYAAGAATLWQHGLRRSRLALSAWGFSLAPKTQAKESSECPF